MLWPRPKIPLYFKGVSEKDWTDWQWQLRNTIKSAEELNQITGKNFPKTLEGVRLTPYLFALIDFKNPQDPIGLQHLPHPAENTETANMEDEGTKNGKTQNSATSANAFAQVWERKQDFLDGDNRLIQQKYPDIVALRIANTCQAFCRFCFEKERTLRHGVATKVGTKEWQEALQKIRRQPRLRQVLLTGGDPSILPDQMLQSYLESLMTIPQLKTIRINTRTLLHNPYRITPEFATMLGQIQHASWDSDHEQISLKPKAPAIKRGKEIKIGLHFNHPRELTPEAITAMRRLQREGIQLYNQTVLLKNINDRVDILQLLFRRLRAEGVELHYLSQAMAVPGTAHFHTRVRDGQKLMEQLRQSKEFRDQLPSFEYSHYTGKQIIPTTMYPKFHEISEKKGRNTLRTIRFRSDITGKWENFEDGK